MDEMLMEAVLRAALQSSGFDPDGDPDPVLELLMGAGDEGSPMQGNQDIWDMIGQSLAQSSDHAMEIYNAGPEGGRTLLQVLIDLLRGGPAPAEGAAAGVSTDREMSAARRNPDLLRALIPALAQMPVQQDVTRGIQAPSRVDIEQELLSHLKAATDAGLPDGQRMLDTSMEAIRQGRMPADTRPPSAGSRFIDQLREDERIKRDMSTIEELTSQFYGRGGTRTMLDPEDRERLWEAWSRMTADMPRP